MKKLERRTTAETRAARRCSSTCPCQSQNATGAPGAAVIDESLTMRRDPRGDGRVDRGDLPLDAARIVGAREEHRLRAVERGAHRRRVGEVADRDLGRVAEERARPLRVADEHADFLVLLQQRPHDLRARDSGCSE